MGHRYNSQILERSKKDPGKHFLNRFAVSVVKQSLMLSVSVTLGYYVIITNGKTSVS